MAKRRTPRNAAPRSRGTEDDIGMSNFGAQVDEGDEADEADEDDDGDDGDEDRGDEHEGSDADDDDDDGDDDDAGEDGDEDGDDDGDEDDADDEGDEGDDDGAAASLEELDRIARENDGMVPIARLNEVLEERRRLQDFILSGGVANAQQRQPAKDDTPPFDLRAKIKERNAAILEGDEDKAADIDIEIEKNRQEESDRRAEQKAQALFEQKAAQAAGESVIATYPKLAQDEESLELVMHTRDLYIAKGIPAAEAIIKAAEKIMGKPAKAPAANGDERLTKEQREKKRFDERKENLRRHRQIPPTTHRSGSSNRSAAADLDVGKLSDRKFNQLDDREKRELRGDHVGKARPKLRKR